MDRIEFVVAQRELGIGEEECAEPVINGVGLVDILNRLDPLPGGYAGLPPHELFRTLRRPERTADVQVLRCVCGDDMCAWARVEVETRPDEVVWHNVRGSHGEPEAYARVGPFRFSREAYERALAEPEFH